MFRILFSLSLFISFVFAQVDAKLEIVKKVNVLPRVLVSISSDSQEKVIVEKIKKILEKDFKVSGHFETKNLDYSGNYDDVPDNMSLGNNGVDLYLNLYAFKDTLGRYVVNIRLYDINSKKMIQEKSFKTSQISRYPFLAHRIAIGVNDFFNAPSIAWMDKFVVLSAYSKAGSANIMLADYTLTFKRVIVSGGLNIFPKWASSAQKEIYYTSYNYKKPTLVKLNIFTGKKSIIMQSDGMISCSDVNSDGSKILITAAPNGQTDIYLYDTISGQKKKITRYSGIDVGGQFLNNGKIAFISNRLGYPNVFVKSINSSAVRQMVYHSKNNSSVTTFENNIVYSSKEKSSEFGGKNL